MGIILRDDGVKKGLKTAFSKVQPLLSSVSRNAQKRFKKATKHMEAGNVVIIEGDKPIKDVDITYKGEENVE